MLANTVPQTRKSIKNVTENTVPQTRKSIAKVFANTAR
jgi:hypothetical protein